MFLFPKAKINIGLYITEKRADGFHNLRTIFYPVGLCDALEFVVAAKNVRKDVLTCSGILPVCRPSDNLVMKALALMRSSSKIPFLRIHLHKAIPSGAGLGGGSSDAATFMAGLNTYFNIGFSNEELKEKSLSLGSDCPFFIEGVPVYAEGRGEIHTPLKVTEGKLFISILKPPVEISTAEAYRGCLPVLNKSDMIKSYYSGPENWKHSLTNDFEKIVFQDHPELEDLKKGLYMSGAVFSSLSGSGSAVYGIFRSKPVLSGTLARICVYSGVL
jgi:4-diphosphocytidyl-2-C-methyl-D-erythritol kinase